MKKNVCLFLPVICSLLSGMSLAGADKKEPAVIRTIVNADDFKDSKKAANLFEEREKLILQMHAKRLEIIRKDPRMKELQTQILALSRELGIAVDSNREIQQLKEKIFTVDNKINSLEKKKKR